MRAARTYLVIATAVITLLVGVWFFLAPTPRLELNPQVAGDDITGTGILDGMTFAGEMGATDGQGPVEDQFVFSKGTFVSTECDRRCGYPARPYFVRNVGDKIEFVSASNCLYKDAKIEWRGTIADGRMEGVSTWTVKRWYWTIEKEIPFWGTLKESAGPVASTQ